MDKGTKNLKAIIKILTLCNAVAPKLEDQELVSQFDTEKLQMAAKLIKQSFTLK